MAKPEVNNTDEFPDLWGLTANQVANRKSSASLSLQEYHLHQEADSQSEVRSIEAVANYPLQLMLNNLAPFNYSIEDHGNPPQTYESVFQNSIKLYQLYTFYVFAISEFGSVHGKKILDIQNKQIGELLELSNNGSLEIRFDHITKTAKLHAYKYMTDNGYVSLDIPVENSISQAFLLSNQESPMYIKDENRFNEEHNFKGLDLALAEHLGQAKDFALQIYSRYFNSIIVKV